MKKYCGNLESQYGFKKISQYSQDNFNLKDSIDIVNDFGTAFKWLPTRAIEVKLETSRGTHGELVFYKQWVRHAKISPSYWSVRNSF